jgi:hypothetical protein
MGRRRGDLGGVIGWVFPNLKNYRLSLLIPIVVNNKIK